MGIDVKKYKSTCEDVKNGCYTTVVNQSCPT